MTNRIPAEAFPPGEFLKDELDERGWTQAEFAAIIGRPPSMVNGLVSGKRGFTPETAREVAAALGTSAMFWLNLESAYRLYLLSHTAPPPDRIVREATLRDEFPVRELLKRGWVAPADDPEVLEQNILKFYGIGSREEQPQLAYAAKRSTYSSGLTRTQQAWLIRLRQIAGAAKVAVYKEQELRDRLDDLHALMVSPEEVRHVVRLLAECGVRLIVIEPLPGSKVDGACLWLSPKDPVIGMTLRLDRIDNFWFVLRHEIEHVLQKHGIDGEPILDTDMDSVPTSQLPAAEQVANAAAADFCIPREQFESWVARVHPIYSEERLIGFSQRLGIHPGIVAGQLRRRLDRWDVFQRHLVKVRHIVTRVTLTDGYGQVNSVIT